MLPEGLPSACPSGHKILAPRLIFIFVSSRQLLLYFSPQDSDLFRNDTYIPVKSIVI